eukprot:m51a1_g1554 hypothetical protein (642) ;mRNA; r:11599-14039
MSFPSSRIIAESAEKSQCSVFVVTNFCVFAGAPVRFIVGPMSTPSPPFLDAVLFDLPRKRRTGLERPCASCAAITTPTTGVRLLASLCPRLLLSRASLRPRELLWCSEVCRLTDEETHAAVCSGAASDRSPHEPEAPAIVPTTPLEAANLERDADCGDAASQYSLGCFLSHLADSIENGQEPGEIGEAIGMTRAEDARQASVRNLETAVAQEHAGACLELARLLLAGPAGLHRDPCRALDLLDVAAARGSEPAASRLEAESIVCRDILEHAHALSSISARLRPSFVHTGASSPSSLSSSPGSSPPVGAFARGISMRGSNLGTLVLSVCDERVMGRPLSDDWMKRVLYGRAYTTLMRIARETRTSLRFVYGRAGTGGDPKYRSSPSDPPKYIAGAPRSDWPDNYDEWSESTAAQLPYQCVHGQEMSQEAGQPCPDCAHWARVRLLASCRGRYVVSEWETSSSAAGQCYEAIYDDPGVRGGKSLDRFKMYSAADIRSVLRTLAEADLEYVHPLWLAQDPNIWWPLVWRFPSLWAALSESLDVELLDDVPWELLQLPEGAETVVSTWYTDLVPGRAYFKCSRDECVELEREDNPFLTCPGCMRKSYHSAACQKAHWAQHKAECKVVSTPPWAREDNYWDRPVWL